MFDIRELQQIVYFMERATISGQESIAHASLLVKIKNMITDATEQQN